MDTPDYWIKSLALDPHPEGGFFRETYRSENIIPVSGLPQQFDGDRAIFTSIYFLLRGNEMSMLHRIKSDEIWYFHVGSSLTLYVLGDDHVSKHILGIAVDKGESLSILVPANCWFGARVNDPSGFTLCSCSVAPGFEFADFELAERSDLIQRYPNHSQLITELTR